MAEPPADSPTSTPGGLPPEIGGYAIQRLLGSGGMATVYAALQKQPRRTVALKVMRCAADARTALHRFKREIEILGKLRHPYIAQVYDAGVHEETGGPLPFFVMEYVGGAKTVHEYAEAGGLSLRDRLKLFVKICAAVEHGHQHRIIHRDLKPGNILIDKAGDPKIIDFGVARAMDMDLSAQTMHTEEGRLIGTIQYMAPEQLETRRMDLDARCDVYALGVLLYKLLTDKPPHDLMGLPVFTAAQVIREDPPPRPGGIKPQLKGDLETIILKSLAKDRAHRYRTAGSLGRDVVRYLAHKPIHARHVGAWRRLRLLAKRHRIELRAGAIVAAVIVIAAAVVVYQRVTMNRPEDAAEGTTPSAADAGGAPGPAPSAADEEAPAGSAAAGMPEPFQLPGHTAPITKLAFDPSGASLAGASGDLTMLLWSVDERQIRLTTTDHDAPIGHIAFSADGSLLVTAADDGRVVFVDIATGRLLDVIRHRRGVVQALALSGAGDRVALAYDDLTLRVFRRDGSAPQTIRGTTGGFHAAAYSHDGTMLAGGSEHGDVYLWEAATGEQIMRFGTLRDTVVCVGFSADDDRIIAVTQSGAGMFCTIGQEQSVRPFALGMGELETAVIESTGRWLACTSSDLVKIWDLQTEEALGEAMAIEDAGAIRDLAISPDGRWFAVGQDDGTVIVSPTPGRW